MALPDKDDTRRAAFIATLRDLRPRLHRYCARMTGSVVDGEDVVQDAAIKALEAFDDAGPIEDTARWLFRIAHNTAIDHLRRQTRQRVVAFDEDIDAIADEVSTADSHEAAQAGLYAFVHLAPGPRSAVILVDVLGHTAEEAAAIVQSSVAAVKASLHRGRARLQALARDPAQHTPSPAFGQAQREQLDRYVALFNARDFDSLRTMLAEDVRLDLVNRLRLDGRAAVSPYFTRYGQVSDWQMVPGMVEGHPAILVFDPLVAGAQPKSFILLDWRDGRVAAIRDFLFAPYVVDGAALSAEQA